MPGPQCRSVGPSNAKIMIVGEAPGEREILEGIPFVGASGLELNRMLHEVGISRGECFITNVCRERPPGNDISKFIPIRKKDILPGFLPLHGKYVAPCVLEGLSLLAKEIALVKPTIILAFGNTPLWALTGHTGITNWRGSVLPYESPEWKCKIIPLYHPAAILRQWSWRSVGINDLRRAKRELEKGPEITVPQYRFILSPQYTQVHSTLSLLLRRAEAEPLTLSCDIETRAGHIACIGLAWSKLDAICIPLMDTRRREGFYLLEEESELMFLLYQLLTHPSVSVVGQNFLYDAQYFYRHLHFLPNLRRDTMLAQHTCFPAMQKGLDFLSSLYCENHVYWKEESKDWDPAIGEAQLWAYNCKDSVITFEVDQVLQSVVDSLSLRTQHDFQQSMFWPVLRAMIRGVAYDLPSRKSFSLELEKSIAETNDWITSVLGHPLNTSSNDQMKKLFYEDLRQPIRFNRKTHTPTLNEESLIAIRDREPLLSPLISKILDLRSLRVFKSTFVDADLDSDSRMRCSYNIAGTETFRFSSSKNAFNSGLNLQNIPKGDESSHLPNVRKLFVPDPGHTLFDIDLSSADLRIVVWESNETELKQMLSAGLDPYTEIAKEFYNDPSITKKDPRRQTFKSFAHGTNYLGSARGLAQRLGLSVAQAERTQAWYFRRFPRIKEWHKRLEHQVMTKREISNVFGYKYPIFDRLEGTILNQCAAWIPQSTVALLINHAWMQIEKSLPSVQILLQVHDSLVGQFPSHTDLSQSIIKSAEVILPYADPLTIPVGIKTSSRSWGDCA